MQYEIVNDFPNGILFEEDDVCISIYQPAPVPKQQARIIFKNQIQKVKKSLELKFKSREVEEILKPLYELEQDHNFWKQTNDAIAILMNRNRLIVYNLFRDLKELSVVSDSFHIKPLLRIYQSADKYYVLGINRQHFKLYYGDRYELRELTFPEDVPVTIEDVLGEELTDSHLGRAASRGRAGTPVSTHGYGDRKTEIEKDTEKYLRYVDRYVLENYSKPAKAPLILVTLSEYQGIFRKLSHNNFLLDSSINKDFQSMSKDAIRKESWDIIEKIYLERTQQLVDRFEAEKATGAASEELEEVAKRAIENRIDLLLMESGKIIPGLIHPRDGKIEQSETHDAQMHDILDKIAEKVFLGRGEVVMLPKERMPTDTGVAAIFRY